MSEVDDFVGAINAQINAVMVCLSIARDTEQQIEALNTLELARLKVEAERDAASTALDEPRANLMLGFLCVLGCLAGELKMWLALKEDKPEAAWDFLIDAQDAALAASRAHPGLRHLSHHFERLEAIEQLVFPPQLFVSSGLVADLQECTICDADYEDCDHIVGQPYLGRFCSLRGVRMRIDHVAIVDHPADKRCRLTTFDDEGGSRNRMTWKLTPKPGATNEATLRALSF